MPHYPVDRRPDLVAQVISRQSGKYLLVCGDFNDSPISYAHHTIEKDCRMLIVKPVGDREFSYNRNFLYFRIDHLFVRTKDLKY